MKMHECVVPGCGAKFPSGVGGIAGRKTGRALCPKHYHRARRNPDAPPEQLQHAATRQKGERSQMTLRPTKELEARLREALRRARANGVGDSGDPMPSLSMGQLLERAVMEAITLWWPADRCERKKKKPQPKETA